MQLLAALLRLLPLSLSPLAPPEQSNTLSTTTTSDEDGSDLCIDFPARYREPKCCKEILPPSLPSVQCTSPSPGTTPQSFWHPLLAFLRHPAVKRYIWPEPRTFERETETQRHLMHQCWDIAELVQLIFEELDPYSFGVYQVDTLHRSNAIALYNLALTCRQLSDPALDILWATNEGLLMLLKCLPSRAWEIRNGCFELIAPLNYNEWERFTEYSRRVRILSTRDGTITIGNSTLQSMASLPSGTLLPNVKTVVCQSSSTIFPYLSVLVGPRLLELAISLDGPTSRASILQDFASCFRLLRCVHVSTPESQTLRELAEGCVPSFVMQLASPKLLVVQGLNHAAYRHIATFPDLRAMEIPDLTYNAFPAPFRPGADTVFPALHELKINASNTLFVANFMSVFQDARFTMINILQRIFAALRDPCCVSPAELLDLHLIFREDDTKIVLANPDPYAMSFDFIHPIFAYSNIRNVSLICPLGFALDDNSVELMARAWPQLESLVIVGEMAHIIIPKSYPTLAALIILSRHCPRLHSLYFSVDATMVPPIENLSGVLALAPPPVLTHWHPVESPIGCSDSVAKFLATCFPKLFIEHTAEIWNDVNKKMDELLKEAPSTLDDHECGGISA
ncbi:hypothetical protein R3P38DRAFT_3590366 [Favolaschia claudopus]|uniref:Uncharacterized protein n=1 Tax=Favolaschia claudopus TaxID=2862362 RepID=A0AAW0AGC3_9AGAR